MNDDEVVFKPQMISENEDTEAPKAKRRASGKKAPAAKPKAVAKIIGPEKRGPVAFGNIATPGVYDLSMTEYHGQPCVAPSISSTGIRQIVDEGLEYFWAFSNLNPEPWPQDPKPHFVIGEAAHLFLMEPERVHSRISVGEFEDFRTNEAKAWRAAVEADGRLPVRPSEFQMLRHMRDALAAHSQVRGALSAGHVEKSLLWKHGGTGVWQKARPDFLPDRNGRLIVDYKTTSDLARWSDKALIDFRYDIQALLQIEGVRELTGIEPLGLLYVIQEKSPPFRVRLRVLRLQEAETDFILQRAKASRAFALEKFAKAVETGQWIDIDGIQPLFHAASPWVQRRILSETNA